MKATWILIKIPDTASGDVSRSQEDALQARSLYSLNKDIVDNVLMAAPILKAIHTGTDSSPIEKYGIPTRRWSSWSYYSHVC